MTTRMLSSQRSRSIRILIVLVILVAATLLLRSWALNSLPPGLWWDEASQGLDARDLLHGHFRVFFSRAEGKEPLYIYLTTPFVAAWDGQPFAVRLAGAVLSALMVLALYLCGRALWIEQPSAGSWAGLIAAALWMVSYWSQSIGRIGFQVNAFPIIITLAVTLWLNWVRRPTRQRALAFGILAGLALSTYLAARFTPFIWLLLYLALPKARRRALRSTLLWALLGASLTAVPLTAHFILHPGDFANRSSVFPLIRGDYGEAIWDPLIGSAREVAGVFLGGAGDPNYRHNIPGRPAFSPALAALFALGFAAAAWSLRRRADLRGWTLLTWLMVLSVPSVLSLASNPHYPRLFGALPAALLLAAWPLAALANRLAKRNRLWLGAIAVAAVLLVAMEGIRTVSDYFETWPQFDLYEAFNGDTMLLGSRIQSTQDAIAVVPGYGDATHVLDYAYPKAPILEVKLDANTIAQWLDRQLAAAGGKQVLVPVWNAEPQMYADAQQAVPFYLQREGRLVTEEHYRNFDLFGFTLGPQPSFGAPGNHVALNQPFSGDVRLVDARWGAAYPNPDRNGTSASAGTPFWVILTWELDRPLTNLRATVELVDPDRRLLSHADQQLLRLEQQESPPSWTPNTVVRTYHLVEAPNTLLPGTATLQVRLYDSETLVPLRPQLATARDAITVDEVTTTAPLQAISRNGLHLAHPIDASLPGGVTLVGADAWPGSMQPGTPLTLRLYWQTDEPLPADQTFTLALDNLPISATVRLPANMPTGIPVHTFTDLRLPPDIETGDYALTLSRPGDDFQPVALGQIEVSGRPRRFDVPALQMPLHATFGNHVSLLGANATSSMAAAPGQPIALTLAWQALATPSQDLVRFVHLLGHDGKPVAQQDGVPCNGQCPASSWLQGEVLYDEVQLVVPADLPPGSYKVGLGWYDRETLERLPAVDASGLRLAEDLVVLPLDVRVEP